MDVFLSFFLEGGNYLGVGLLSQRVGVCLTWQENAKLLSKVAVAFYTPTSRVQEC